MDDDSVQIQDRQMIYDVVKALNPYQSKNYLNEVSLMIEDKDFS